MKIPVISLLSLAFAGLALASVPKKGALQTYSTLWNNSPFTTKPIVEPKGPAEDPFKDYALIGVSPIGASQYRVTLINKKQPEDRIMVFSDSKGAEFEILKVIRKEGDPLGTIVSLKSGNMTGTVSYDEKLLTLAAPVAAKPPVPQHGQPPIPGMVQPVPQPGDPRMPRPRVVPPPTPTNAGQPQVQPPSPSPGQSQHNFQRPERRRN